MLEKLNPIFFESAIPELALAISKAFWGNAIASTPKQKIVFNEFSMKIHY